MRSAQLLAAILVIAPTFFTCTPSPGTSRELTTPPSAYSAVLAAEIIQVETTGLEQDAPYGTPVRITAKRGVDGRLEKRNQPVLAARLLGDYVHYRDTPKPVQLSLKAGQRFEFRKFGCLGLADEVVRGDWELVADGVSLRIDGTATAEAREGVPRKLGIVETPGRRYALVDEADLAAVTELATTGLEVECAYSPVDPDSSDE